jgi:hypothetical protein
MMRIFGGFVMLISFYGLEQGSDPALVQSFLFGLFMFFSEYLFSSLRSLHKQKTQHSSEQNMNQLICRIK